MLNELGLRRAGQSGVGARILVLRPQIVSGGHVGGRRGAVSASLGMSAAPVDACVPALAGWRSGPLRKN